MSTVFFDVDTQVDFLFPAGALYVPGAEGLLPNLARLNQYAAAKEFSVVSTMDAHAENDPEFRQWPAHCVAGTFGKQKAQATLLDRRVVVPSHKTDFDLSGARQIILEKQSTDCFTNANIHEVLARLDAKHCVLYGVVTEVCVRHAALGLLASGRKVELVTDAVRHLDEGAASRFLAEFESSGGVLTTTAQVCR